MNPKKFLQILEILCPIFTKVEDKNGNPDSTTPGGYAVWLAARVSGCFKAVWTDNEIMDVTDKFVMFFVKIFISILVFPFALLMWTIGNLIFSIRYDKRKNNKSHLFLMYSFVVVLFIALGVMLVDYHYNGEITEQINISITDTVNDIQDMQTKRSNPRQSGVKPTNSELIVTETTTQIVTEVIMTEQEESDGYTIQRKTR